MVPHLIEIALLLLAFFLIGCLIGYYVRRWTVGTNAETKTASVEPATKAATAATAVTETAAKTAPAAPEKAEPAKPKAQAKTTAAKATAAKATAAKAASATTTKSAPAKAAAKSTAAAKAKKPAAAKDEKPEQLKAPRDGQKDDLKEIKGIGPRIETKLNEMGVFHIDQIAAWDRKAVKWVDEELAFKGRIDREEWIKQAKAITKAK